MNSLSRISRTSDYRGLSPVEKGLKLMEEEEVSLRQAAETVGITISMLQRAQRALAEGRDVGKHGRPRILNTKEERMLVEAVVEAEIIGKALTHKRLREVV